ncbi:1,2-phenylacetyl-CoA epoxidase subunit PaaD [Nocardioides marmorisolisilvae]|uniref:Phenylacetate-CoA oxygenase subunit PaaJ n=1 Tax=Nocardioides marmorisolisilvae TaxID=1542737 RepID=A0A3N0DWG7_9ACTN|nr:1,2-phenylacetyl-CoA epoxidase subunit PaaD [Nocardioides marmorisolisilvae]RNL79783.1 phenylacetate-CoA oxygenase subunit PaaJ [Nocardioides marmorisolisilvae]
MSTPVADELRRRIEQVADPELPVVTIADLGILREITEHDGVLQVTITPTYAGCPAMDAIRADIAAAVSPHEVVVHTVLAPAWSTDDITETGRQRLAEHGVAPPAPVRGGPVDLTLGTRPVTPRCPHCGSGETREASPFSSTACKALYVCASCWEPFDYFKPL